MNKYQKQIKKRKKKNSKRLAKVEYNTRVKEEYAEEIRETKVYSKLGQPLD